jgi:hypothetical protein
MSSLTNHVNRALTGEDERDKDQGLQLGQRQFQPIASCQ